MNIFIDNIKHIAIKPQKIQRDNNKIYMIFSIYNDVSLIK